MKSEGMKLLEDPAFTLLGHGSVLIPLGKKSRHCKQSIKGVTHIVRRPFLRPQFYIRNLLLSFTAGDRGLNIRDIYHRICVLRTRVDSVCTSAFY